MTETFTAAAILQLVATGKVSLDDDIGRYLSELPMRGKGVTIRRLLDHTAGVPGLTASSAYWAQAANAIEPVGLTKFFADAPLAFERRRSRCGSCCATVRCSSNRREPGRCA